MTVTSIFVLVSLVFVLLYSYYKRTYGYWKSKGVPYVDPEHFFFGSSFDIIFSRKTMTAVLQKIYDTFPRDKFCGFFHLTRPRLMILDSDLVVAITVKDFSYFRNRYLHANTELDPLSAHLLNLRDDQWKTTRNKLTPIFSSNKLKEMHGQVLECANSLVEHLSSTVDSGIEISDFVRRFSTDALSTCTFGINVDSVNNPSSTLFRIAKRMFEPSRLFVFRRFLRSEFNWFFNMIQWKNVPIAYETYFKNLIDGVLEFRHKHSVQRVDFLQLTNNLVEKDLQLIKDGQLSKDNPNVFTQKLLYANAFVFLLAGFETTTSTICYSLYELALNMDIQEVAYQEVKRIFAKHGQITHGSTKEMTFLSQVMSESLRKYPPVPVTNREAAEDYKIPGTNVILPKGMEVMIPIYSIHHDPQHYPEPSKFKPERFSPEGMSQIKPGTYLPFGEGPRKCIGVRFAELQYMVALSRILLEFKVTPCEKTKVPLTWDRRTSFFITAKGGIWIKLVKRMKL